MSDECGVPAIDCSSDACYLVGEATDGICTRPVFFDRTRGIGRVHHHSQEEAPAPIGT